MAGLHEQRGDTTRAISYYGRFVDLWTDADPELQLQVAAARRAIESLSRATLAVFDKTGTLTRGLPRITAVFVTDNAWTEHDCRAVAVCVLGFIVQVFVFSILLAPFAASAG